MALALMYFLCRNNPAGSMREYAPLDNMSLHPSNSYPTDPGSDSRLDLLSVGRIEKERKEKNITSEIRTACEGCVHEVHGYTHLNITCYVMPSALMQNALHRAVHPYSHPR